ncbi:MAG: radical SAM/SPASM domain-containing protein [Bacillota bacterium]
MLNENVSLRFSDAIPLLKGRMPGQLVIQYTDLCNAHCPQCGMRVTESYSRSKMNINEAKRIIDSAAEKGIKSLSFTGGEPMLYFDEIVTLIQYAGESGIPYIRTGTNGFIFMNSQSTHFTTKINRIAEALAKTPIRNFWISIDSAEASIHEKMRGLPGVVQGIEKALPIFHDYNIYPSANLGINRNTGGLGEFFIEEQAVNNPGCYYNSAKQAFEKFYQFVIDLGFTIVNACYPMSIDPQSDTRIVYGANSVDHIIRFTEQEKVLIFKALSEAIDKYRAKIRIFTPRSALYALIKHYSGNQSYSYPCRGGIDFFFIDHQTNVYPCGYLGHKHLGKFWNLDLKKINEQASCRECDWECFRDPSEVMGHFIELFQNPLNLIQRLAKDRDYLRLWLGDLWYYKKCDFFNGRLPIK